MGKTMRVIPFSLQMETASGRSLKLSLPTGSDIPKKSFRLSLGPYVIDRSAGYSKILSAAEARPSSEETSIDKALRLNPDKTSITEGARHSSDTVRETAIF